MADEVAGAGTEPVANAESWADEMDEEDAKEAEKEKEQFEAIKAKIEEETEKARKRAERFGAEFTEPNVELILDQDELYLYRKITDPDSLKASKGPRVQYRSQRIDGGLLDGAHEIRDRDYTQQLLEKVAAAQRAARARAERFGVEYVEPKLNVILSREEYRKYMSATGGRNPLMLETAPVAGIDTTTEDEKARIQARADRFKAASGTQDGDEEAVAAVAARAAAEAELQEREGLRTMGGCEIDVLERLQAEFAREQAALEARAAKFGVELTSNPYGEDLHPSVCARREIPTVGELAELVAAAAAEGAPTPNVDVVLDTLHVYGVDRLNTDEILRYFSDYAPSYVLWLDDSSCNLVFGDAANARRALFSLGQPIRQPAAPEPAAEDGMGDDGAAAEPKAAQTDPVWRRGPNYEKVGFEYAVLMRQAVSTDVKKGKPGKSKRLWLEGSGKRGGGYAGGYSGDYRGERMGGGSSRARGQRQGKAQQERSVAPMGDLRASLGKAKKERRGRKQRHNPYGMQIDDDEGQNAEVAMMDADEAQRIMSAPTPSSGPSHELTAQEQALLDGASAAVDSMAE